MAKSASNSDFKIQHPDWIQAAVTDKYIQLTSDVKKKVERQQALAIIRRNKLGGKT